MNLSKEYSARNDLLPPDGKVGDWAVETFHISDRDSLQWMMKELVNPKPFLRSLVPPGEYKKLTCQGVPVMSNTPEELVSCQPAIDAAHGHVLITGLGLGIVPQCLLRRRKVESVTIVETSQEVIDLVGPYLEHGRLRIVKADAWEYIPDRSYDFAWHDIWTVGPDHTMIPEIKRLMKRYEPWCARQDFWLQKELSKVSE